MTFRQEALEERRKEVLPRLREARQLAEKCETEGRALTDAEQKSYDDAVRDAKSLSDAFEKQRHDAAVFAFAKELGESVGDPAGGGAARTKGQRLSFKGMGGALARSMQPDGAKALAPSGAAVVSQSFEARPGQSRQSCDRLDRCSARDRQAHTGIQLFTANDENQ